MNIAHFELVVITFVRYIGAMSSTVNAEVLAAMEEWLVEQERAIALLKSTAPDIVAAAVVARTRAGREQVLNLIRAIEHGVYL